MTRCARGALLIAALLAGGLAAAATVAFTVSFARTVEHTCTTGFPTVIDCKFTW